MWRELLLFVHLAGVIVWVGGMFFAYFCLRPAAALRLEPAQRLPLWLATYQRFFVRVTVSVGLIWVSGVAMFMQGGAAPTPTGWQVMAALGGVMTAGFAYVRLVLYPRLRRQLEAGPLPAAAATLNAIRGWVAVNLVLSAFTLAAAVASR